MNRNMSRMSVKSGTHWLAIVIAFARAHPNRNLEQKTAKAAGLIN